MHRARLAALGMLLLLVSGCHLVTPEEPLTVPVLDPGPARSEAGDGRFRLSLTLPSATWEAGAPIDGEAMLELDEGVVEIGGSGGGLISFRYSQVDGRLVVDPISTADCARHRLSAAEPLRVALDKSGGWSEEDPDAVFYREFLQADGVRLPPGQWDITAIASGGCDGSAAVFLETTVRILVTS